MKKQQRSRSLIKFLEKYSEIEDDILLVYRPSQDSSWAIRHKYLSEEYNHRLKYNHRSILRNEVVCEYDTENKELNRELSDRFARKLTENNISWSKWDSGNKSTHLHFFIDTQHARRIHLLKSVMLRHFGCFSIDGKTITPDLRLASDNHLIRAEFGIHEKTGQLKSPISTYGEYPKLCMVPTPVWEHYASEVKRIVYAKVTKDVNTLIEHPGFKYILTAERFRSADDGRERALFMLIHVLKPKYTKEELISYLQEWYRYSGGIKLSDKDVENKVRYHWNREYTFSNHYLENLLYEIGREDLIQTFKSKVTPTLINRGDAVESRRDNE